MLLGKTARADETDGTSKISSARSNLVELSYSWPDGFNPSNVEAPALDPTKPIRVLSSHEKGNFGPKGTFVFLHGAGGTADEYNTLWTRGDIDLPSGFTIVFVQSPRGKYGSLESPWLIPSSSWEERPETVYAQVNDNVTILKHVLYELQPEAGGYSKLWLCGRSQGACLSTLLAVAGVGPTVAGSFAIAATAVPQLCDVPSDGTYSPPSQDKIANLKLGFYSGTKDTQFGDVTPQDENGTFPLLSATLRGLGFFSGDTEKHFWLKAGATHNSIGPSEAAGDEVSREAFGILFAFAQGQDPAKAGADGVSAWQ